MNINRASKCIHVVSPNLFQQDFARQRRSRMLHKIAQKLKLTSREGNDFSLASHGCSEKIDAHLAELVDVLRAAGQQPDSVGVVLDDARFAAVRKHVAKAGIDTGLPHEDGADHKVSLVPVGLAKGLEFDHVVVLEPAEIAAAGATGLRLLYIALTRAISRLTVLHTQPLPTQLNPGESRSRTHRM